MTNKTRIALKLAYIGDRYHGFQIQQNAHAIESEIFASLEKNNIVDDIKEARYSGAARTDRGVHASGQVIAFDTSTGFGDPLPRIINRDLPDDIWVWAHAVVPSGFDARRDAVRRILASARLRGDRSDTTCPLSTGRESSVWTYNCRFRRSRPLHPSP